MLFLLHRLHGIRRDRKTIVHDEYLRRLKQIAILSGLFLDVLKKNTGIPQNRQ
jgi:hypothetical protein